MNFIDYQLQAPIAKQTLRFPSSFSGLSGRQFQALYCRGREALRVSLPIVRFCLFILDTVRQWRIAFLWYSSKQAYLQRRSSGLYPMIITACFNGIDAKTRCWPTDKGKRRATENTLEYTRFREKRSSACHIFLEPACHCLYAFSLSKNRTGRPNAGSA